MVLVFYEPSRRKRRTAGEDGAGPGGVVCVVVLPDQVLVLMAPVTKEGMVLEEEGCGFALWGGDAGDGRDLPNAETFILERVKGIRPAGAWAIPVTDWRSGKQTSVAARDERGGYDIRDFEGRLSGAVRGAAIDTLAGALFGTVVPGPGITSLATVISALDKLEKLLEPRGILLTLVSAAAQAVAIHAGLGSIAPLIGQFAENTVSGLLGPEDATDHPAAARLLKGAKVAAYADGGTLAQVITDLFLTPAIESALRQATESVDWVQAGRDQRAAERLRRLKAAADPPKDRRSARGILEATMADDPPEDEAASAAGPAVSPLS
jgi:hypothetical protein